MERARAERFLMGVYEHGVGILSHDPVLLALWQSFDAGRIGLETLVRYVEARRVWGKEG
jgi:hypothetical protein